MRKLQFIEREFSVMESILYTRASHGNDLEALAMLITKRSNLRQEELANMPISQFEYEVIPQFNEHVTKMLTLSSIMWQMAPILDELPEED